MGSGSSAPKQTHTARNKAIEDKINARRAEEKSMIKILLLGAGECGKSTILKQMKIINMNGFSEEEKEEARDLVFSNTVDSMQSLISAMDFLGIEYEKEASQEMARKIMDVDSSEVPIPCDVAPDIAALWADEGIQECRSRENEFHLIDSAPYFLDRVIDYFKADYQPSQQDILRTRKTTSGIIETTFAIQKTYFKMYDVGGQRGERKKWIHCFGDVTAIMFIASLSEYDQVLVEDRDKNRLDESLTLFEGIANLPWFKGAQIILFLNKRDLFEEKVLRSDIGDWHKSYTGGLDYDAGLKYIKRKYRKKHRNEELYVHVTDATNTENVAYVWKATKHIILEQRMGASGMNMC